MREYVKGGVGLLVAVGLAGGLIFGIFKLVVGVAYADREISLPVLAMGGVVALLVTLAAVSVAFALFGLADRTQALALPEGSIRAVVSLALIVLFAILSVYLYERLSSGGRFRTEEFATLSEAQAFVAQNKGLQEVSIRSRLLPASAEAVAKPPATPEAGQASLPEAKQDAGADMASRNAPPAAKRGAAPVASAPVAVTAEPAVGAGAGKGGTIQTAQLTGGQARDVTLYEVTYRPPGRSESDDFAKQLLVMIGTLMTAVSSFYFGSRAIAPQDGPRAAAPGLRAVKPPSLTVGNHDLEITGDNLNTVKQVKLVHQKDQIVATEIVSNDSVVKCKVAIESSTTKGAWDVVVIDASSRTAVLSAVLTIT